MRGWKVFDENLRCKGFQYIVGETFKHEGEIQLCESGFHFHTDKSTLFTYYEFSMNNRVCEIEAGGEIISSDEKSVCSQIKIIRELGWDEIFKLINDGENNEGIRNVGNGNVGDNNKGNFNIGSYNTGFENQGNNNSGNENIGHNNLGNENIGHNNLGNENRGNKNNGYHNCGNNNSGDNNLGSRNNGNFNRGNYNFGNNNFGDFNFCDNAIGYFNTESCTEFHAFNRTCTREEWANSKIKDFELQLHLLPLCLWTEEIVSKWEQFGIKNLPNFDLAIFKKIMEAKERDQNANDIRIQKNL